MIAVAEHENKDQEIANSKDCCCLYKDEGSCNNNQSCEWYGTYRRDRR